MNIRKAKNLSPTRRLNFLMKEKGRWQRRETIARNKLERIDWAIEELLDEVIRVPKDKMPDEVNDYAKRKLLLK